jgi:hypothetical protein
MKTYMPVCIVAGHERLYVYQLLFPHLSQLGLFRFGITWEMVVSDEYDGS